MVYEKDKAYANGLMAQSTTVSGRADTDTVKESSNLEKEHIMTVCGRMISDTGQVICFTRRAVTESKELGKMTDLTGKLLSLTVAKIQSHAFSKWT